MFRYIALCCVVRKFGFSDFIRVIGLFARREVIDFQKNFHDEQEWRYVPSINVAATLQKDTIIANPYMLHIE